MKTVSHFDRGGVRELSYDPVNARPFGQTAAQIREDAKLQRYADRHRHVVTASHGREFHPHVPRPDRFYLLRFLGLNVT